MRGGVAPVEEVHGAFERGLGTEPLFGQDRQPAGDSVEVPDSAGGAVRLHAVADSPPVDEPGHADVVRVEAGGHAHQGLLPGVPLVSPALLL